MPCRGVAESDAVVVQHGFQKKHRATSMQAIDIAKSRHAELMRGQR